MQADNIPHTVSLCAFGDSTDDVTGYAEASLSNAHFPSMQRSAT